MSRTKFSYDVFISYSSYDQQWVRDWLLPALEQNDLKVCIDYKSFEPGAPSLTEMERAVLTSRKIVLMLTPNYLNSQWTEFENILAQALDPAARQRRLIPLLLPRCDKPPRLASLVHIDFTKREEHEAGLQKLIGNIRKKAVSKLPASAPRGPSVEERQTRRDYCQRLIATNEYLDFRGIWQMQEILRLRLEDLYVPLWAITEATQRVLTRHDLAEVSSLAGAGRNPSRDREGAEQEAETTQLVEARGFQARRASKTPRQAQTDEQLLDNLLHVERTPEKRVEIAKALREHQRLVVLGDPGTGKSTLLKLLALIFARGRSFVQKKLDLDEDRLPLLIPIAAYGEAVAANMNLSFADFLLHRLAQDGLPDHRLVQAALDQGECLLLLDGLDEVLDLNTRLHVSRQIERFLNTCDLRNRVVVTSRIAGYQRVGFTGDFVHLTLLPFAEEEITAFVRHWAEAYERQTNPHDHERRAAQRARVLTDAILSAPAIRSLAANPLLVTILALIHQQGTRLPHQRVELYRLCVEALAEHWQRARSLYKPIDMYLGPRRLDEPYVVGMLAPIAFTLFKTKLTGLLHRTDLERQIAERLIEYEEVGKADAPSLARQFVELMREQSGLLIERGADLFDFFHPTFKEYLAARSLAQRREPLQLIGTHLFAPRWREVILLTAGILKGDYLDDFLEGILQSGSDQFDAVLQRPLLLAARCLADEVPASAPVRRKIRDQLLEVWKQPPTPRLRDDITQLFVRLTTHAIAPEVLNFLLHILQDGTKDSPVRSAAAGALGQVGEAAATAPVLSALLTCLTDKDSSVRSAAARALGRLGAQAATGEVLQQLAEFWQSQLHAGDYRFFGDRYERIGDVAYEELSKIVWQLEAAEESGQERGTSVLSRSARS